MYCICVSFYTTHYLSQFLIRGQCSKCSTDQCQKWDTLSHIGLHTTISTIQVELLMLLPLLTHRMYWWVCNCNLPIYLNAIWFNIHWLLFTLNAHSITTTTPIHVRRVLYGYQMILTMFQDRRIQDGMYFSFVITDFKHVMKQIFTSAGC